MGDISNTQYFKAVQDEKKMQVSQVLHDVYEALKEKGVEGILLDIDNTLIDYTKKLSKEMIDWVYNAKKEGLRSL